MSPEDLRHNLQTSLVGLDILAIFRQKRPEVILNYRYPGPIEKLVGGKVCGECNEITNEMQIWVPRTPTVTRTAKAVVHEGTHAAGIRNSLRAEVIAHMRAGKHVKELSLKDVHAIIRAVPRSYLWLDQWVRGDEGFGTHW